MPRGIPNKPKEEPETATDEQKMYGLYVKGVRIQEIADGFKVDPQVVIEIVNTFEKG